MGRRLFAAQRLAIRMMASVVFLKPTWLAHSVRSFDPANLNLKFRIEEFPAQLLGLLMFRVPPPRLVGFFRIKLHNGYPFAVGRLKRFDGSKTGHLLREFIHSGCNATVGLEMLCAQT